MKPARCRRTIVGETHVFNLTAPGLSHFVEQKSVHRSANTKRKHASVLMFLNLGDDLHIVAYVTVSHEANDAHMALIVRRFKRRFDGSHHFSTAAASAIAEKSLSLA